MTTGDTVGPYANGTHWYRYFRHLSVSDPLSKYQGAKIYGLFRVVDSKVAKPFEPLGPGWLRVNQYEYWNPFQHLEQLQQYVTGDEYETQVQGARYIVPGNLDFSSIANPFSIGGKAFGFSASDVGTGKIIGSDLYRATFQYVQWEKLKAGGPFSKDANPYGGVSVQVWIKITGGATSSAITGSTYWYHPVQKRFYTIPTTTPYLIGAVENKTEASIREGRILSLIAQGRTRAQAVAEIDAGSPGADAGSPGTGAGGTGAGGNGAGGTGVGGNGAGTNKNGSQAEQSTAPKAAIKATVRVRGNFGFVAPGEPEGGEPQMVQYYKSGNSQLQTTARHYFIPKPNQINYQNLGSEWTEIERVGRIPLVDWKNYKLMKVSFEFLVVPDNTYRVGAFGETADDGVTFSIDEKLENLRNMAARPYPVILYGFDDLLVNANPFSMSTGVGVQFVISELSISSLIRTSTGSINRATCSITLQEVPIEYINIISLPKLVPGQIIPPPPTLVPPEYGAGKLFTTVIASPVNTFDTDANR
jgi:hypothetical protein